MYTITLNNLNDTHIIADLLASCLPKKGVITFFGKMGAGKTTFIARLIETLYRNYNLTAPIVTSPTFSLIHEYDINDYKIAHFDLYRLKNPDDILNLGFHDYTDTALCFIEWAENAIDYIDNLILKCEFIVDNNRRILTLSPYGCYSLDNKKFNHYIIR